jgi:hypothetical protein
MYRAKIGGVEGAITKTKRATVRAMFSRERGEIVMPAMRWISRLFGYRRERVTDSSREPYHSPVRLPRVTDDDDDGLAGALVPRKPLPPRLTGSTALEIPRDEKAS